MVAMPSRWLPVSVVTAASTAGPRKPVMRPDRAKRLIEGQGMDSWIDERFLEANNNRGLELRFYTYPQPYHRERKGETSRICFLQLVE